MRCLKYRILAISLAMAILSGCTEPESPQANTIPPVTPNPAAASYNTQLGVAYLRQGDVTRGKEKLLLAKKQDPNSPDVWDALAYFYQATGNTSLADQYYRKAISLKANNGSALNNYGAFLCAQQRYNESIKYFLDAAQIQSYVNTAQAFENAGLCAEQIPDKKIAEQYFTRALENNPDLPTSTLELAQINFEKGKFDLANRYLKRYNAIGKPTAESVWLDAQLAEEAKDQARLTAALQTLQQQFASSAQYKQAQLSGLIK